MNMDLRPFTIAIVIIGVLAGTSLALFASRWPEGSEINVVLLNLGCAMVATALISIVLDIFWSKERARIEKGELQPLLEDFNKFAHQLEVLEGRLEAFKQLGLNSCHSNRTAALERFLVYSQEVVHTPLNQGANNDVDTPTISTVNLVCSSARGLMGYLDRQPRAVQQQWRELITANPRRFRILLTHPAYAHLRQPAEERAPGDIELEVLKTAVYLHSVAGMRDSELRFYRGSPTVFTIQAGQHILLNPYPYGRMAMETLCLEFESDKETTFVAAFVGMHFDHTWAFLDQPAKLVDGKPMVVGVKSFTDILEAFGECTYLGDSSRLRLEHAQVAELDTFTRNLKEKHRKVAIPPPDTQPFASYVREARLWCSDQVPQQIVPSAIQSALGPVTLSGRINAES